MRRFISLLVLLLAIGAACSDSGEDIRDSLLTGVPNADIDGSTSSLKLEPAPADSQPAIEREMAGRKALEGHPGEVLETVLLSYTDLVRQPPSPRLVWAVNYDPAGTSPQAPLGCRNECPSPYGLIYQFVLIDAETGDFITSANASGPIPTP